MPTVNIYWILHIYIYMCVCVCVCVCIYIYIYIYVPPLHNDLGFMKVL
jgi:hypothetical protein